MKVKLLQQDLNPSLQAVARSSAKTTLPVLANILLQTESGKLKLSATNLEIGVIKRVKAEILEAGEITIPARTLVEIISSLQGAELTLESLSDQLKITSSNFTGSLNGISATEFPPIPLSSEQSVLIDIKLLQQSLPQITFAASPADEGRPILTGILTEIKNRSLELVATDGFRLAHKKVTLQSPSPHSFKALIPRRTFEEVVRLIGEDLSDSNTTKNIEIATSENQNQMIFKLGDTQLSSRLIEGNFPTWEKIVPQKFENSTTIDRQELLKAIKLASVFAKDNSSIIKIKSADNKLVITSEARELGSQETAIDAKVEGTEILIAFNARYLIDALSAAHSDEVLIEFSGNISPALIKPVGEEGLEYVVMPIRLS